MLKGDLLGVKARIETRNIENEDESKRKIMEVIAEKIIYLSSQRN